MGTEYWTATQNFENGSKGTEHVRVKIENIVRNLLRVNFVKIWSTRIWKIGMGKATGMK